MKQSTNPDRSERRERSRGDDDEEYECEGLTSNRGRSARFDWDDPPSRVSFNLFPKGDGKTQLGLAHEKLPDGETAERFKLMWREQLGALKQLLERR